MRRQERGSHLVWDLIELFGVDGASKYLKSINVPGIRYLDAGSRGTGQGTHNYVVFDDALIEILKRHGVPVEGLLGVAMPSIWDMDYGTVRKGTGRLSGREAPRETPSLWDYINAVSMTPVPGVSDVAAGLLAAKDFREGNYGSGALNAAGVLPFVPALSGIFKGVKGATTAEKKALLNDIL